MIWLLVALVLGAAAAAALYEWVAVRTGLFPSITVEVRTGERALPILYAPIMFALGVLAGHFWQ